MIDQGTNTGVDTQYASYTAWALNRNVTYGPTETPTPSPPQPVKTIGLLAVAAIGGAVYLMTRKKRHR